MTTPFSFRTGILLLAISLVGLMSLSAGDSPAETPAPPPRPASVPEDVTIFTVEQRTAAAKLHVKRHDFAREKARFRAEVTGAFEEEKFAELNAMAREAIASETIFGDGTWKIYNFYQALIVGGDGKEKVFAALEPRFLRWTEQTPDAITAWMALAEFYIGYAWQARGGGYANTVKEEQWKVFRERLAKAGEALVKASKLQETDPYWYSVMASLGRSQQWPADKYGLMFEDGLRNYPTNWELACARAYGLLPRWYGNPGDWEAFAEQESQREGGLGAEVYARIVISLFTFYDNVFKDTDASWEKTREGLEILRKKYPEDDIILNNAVLLARVAGDKETARAMLAQMGDTYHSGMWRSPQDVILMREWAQSP